MTQFDRQPDDPPRAGQRTAGDVGRFIAGVFVGLIGIPILLLGGLSCLIPHGIGSLFTSLVMIFVVVVLVRNVRAQRAGRTGRSFGVGVATGFSVLLLLVGVCFAAIIRFSGH
jgi:hypothetical protein